MHSDQNHAFSRAPWPLLRAAATHSLLNIARDLSFSLLTPLFVRHFQKQHMGESTMNWSTAWRLTETTQNF